MEATINRNLSLAQMEKVFAAEKVRFFIPTDKHGIEKALADKDAPVTFAITIRHAENETADQVFDNAFNNAFKSISRA